MAFLSWGFWVHYKEVIANGLDLLSFILITPEVLSSSLKTSGWCPSRGRLLVQSPRFLWSSSGYQFL